MRAHERRGLSRGDVQGIANRRCLPGTAGARTLEFCRTLLWLQSERRDLMGGRNWSPQLRAEYLYRIRNAVRILRGLQC